MRRRWVILLCCIMLFAEGCGRSAEQQTTTETSDGTQSSAQAILGDWTPYRVDDTPINALSPYLIDITGVASMSESTVDPAKRIEGFPDNYPYDLIPPLPVESVHETSDEDGDVWISMDSTVSYTDAVAFYRKLLSDKPSFKEFNDSEAEVSFYALVTKWEVHVRLMDWEEDGHASVEINLFDLSTED